MGLLHCSRGSYLVLAVAFRSVLLPMKAIVMNSLWIAGVFGVLVWVFQDGHLTGLMGFKNLGYIESTMPVVIVCTLSACRWTTRCSCSRGSPRRTRPERRIATLSRSAWSRPTYHHSAASILVVVGLAVTTANVVIVKELGLASPARSASTTLIRSLLVPATMRVLGDWNWWPSGRRGRGERSSRAATSILTRQFRSGHCEEPHMPESESLTLQPPEAPSPLSAAVHEDDRPPVVRALAAAALAAALGAAAWALMVIVTDHSFGLAAAGLGVLSGHLIHRMTGGRRGVFSVAVAAVSIVVALVVGKYAAFAYVIHRDAQQRFGAVGGRYYGYLSGHTWGAFHSSLGTEFSPFYLLWVGFGVYAAWRIVGPARTARTG